MLPDPGNVEREGTVNRVADVHRSHTNETGPNGACHRPLRTQLARQRGFPQTARIPSRTLSLTIRRTVTVFKKTTSNI